MFERGNPYKYTDETGHFYQYVVLGLVLVMFFALDDGSGLIMDLVGDTLKDAFTGYKKSGVDKNKINKNEKTESDDKASTSGENSKENKPPVFHLPGSKSEPEPETPSARNPTFTLSMIYSRSGTYKVEIINAQQYLSYVPSNVQIKSGSGDVISSKNGLPSNVPGSPPPIQGTVVPKEQSIAYKKGWI